jgi:hypothetical protein
MLPETPVGDPWWAITVAVIYFGSVIAFGAAARMICARLMAPTCRMSRSRPATIAGRATSSSSELGARRIEASPSSGPVASPCRLEHEGLTKLDALRITDL